MEATVLYKENDDISDYEIQSDEKQRIASYWTRRSESFAQQREAELESRLHERWLENIKSELQESKGALKILDVGTGSGFFAILLAQEGHRVTGIDLTEAMIVNARRLAARHGCNAEFEVMDAEQLRFPSESFDVVISRNLTWTLPHPEQAYAEWMRVLKPGGVLLNYDANYGAACFTRSEEELPAEHAHSRMEHSLLEECQEIKDRLTISCKLRPQWDEALMHRMGYRKVTVNTNVSELIYKEQDELYNPEKMFSLKVVKEPSSARKNSR